MASTEAPHDNLRNGLHADTPSPPGCCHFAATSESIVYQVGFWLASGKTGAMRTRRDRERKDRRHEMVASYSHAVSDLLIRNPPDPVEKKEQQSTWLRRAASGAVLRDAIASKGDENPIRCVLRSTKRANRLRSTIRPLFEDVSWQTLHQIPDRIRRGGAT